MDGNVDFWLAPTFKRSGLGGWVVNFIKARYAK
jgi:hypothetical protein